ncbi:hypothetical protein J5690_09395 [bacterium]|nr:hypothetical protein [bacterium]
MRSFHIFIIVSAVFLLIASCNSGGPNYVFDSPAAYTTVQGTVCKNGKTSYMAFVVDNTLKYGARIKKISGCEKKIDKSLKDKRDKKRGIYVGGTGVSIDKIISNGEAIVAVASTGRVIADHRKDEKKEEMHLPDHKGRIVLRKFDNEIEHVKEFNRSFLLDFYPEIVKNFNDEGFFFSGSDFAAYYIGFVDPEGFGSWKEIDFPVAEIAVIGKTVYLFDDITGTVYTADKDLEPEELTVLDDYKEGRMMRLYGGKLAFFKDNKVEIFDKEMNSLNTLETPEGFDISAVNVFPYSSGYKYRKFEGESITEKIQVFKKDLADEEKDALSEENISVSSAWETIEAESGEIIWIAMKNGYVRAYDLNAGSWLVEPFDSTVTSTYELEMRPYLAANYTSFPKNSATTYDNVPFVDKVSVARGITSPMIYRFVYEGLDEEGSSTKGAYTVTREEFGGKVSVGTATELSSGDNGDSVSFEDDYISVVIKRADDSFETEPETSFYLSIGQGVPFVGFASADVMTEIESPSPLRFFGFSALTRRFVEYNMFKDEVEKVYK